MDPHTPSASQRVFYILEVLEIIIGAIPRDSDLASMARVAYPSHEPSIRRLWSGKMFRQRPGWSHYLNLFPPGLTNSKKVDRWTTTITFSRTPLDSDWVRVEHYSKHLRMISWGNTSFGAVSPEFISLFRGRSGLFPRLQAITVHWLNIVRDPSWMKISGLKLKSLTIQSEWSTDTRVSNLTTFADLLQMLSVQSPNIETLCLPNFELLSHAGSSDNFEQVASAAITNWTNLRTFSWNGWIEFPSGLARSILSKSSLRDVEIGDIDQPTSYFTEDIHVPHLVRLSFQGQTEVITRYLENLKQLNRIQVVEITVLDLSFSQSPFQPTIHLNHLTKLVLTFDRITETISWSRFENVLECPLITEFCLELGGKIEGFDEDALMKLGNSWKSLRSLSVVADHRLPIALVALGTLANSCLNISSIQLTVSMEPSSWRYSSRELLGMMRLGKYKSSNRCILEGLDFHRTKLRGRGGEDVERAGYLNPKEVAQIIQRIWPYSPAMSISFLEEGPDPEEETQYSDWEAVREFWLVIVEKENVIRQKEELQRERDRLKSENAILVLENRLLHQQLQKRITIE